MVERRKQVIDSSGIRFADYFKDLIRYKDLLLTLSVRDFKVRYSQTLLGFVWAFIQPLTTVLVLIVVFDKTLHVNTGNIPYPLYAMAGISLWTYFGFVINNAGNSIINSQSIISKVYFPRLILPLSKSIVGLIDLMISILILTIFFIYFRFTITSQLIFAPVFILLTLLTAVGAGIIFSSLSIRLRDFQHVIPFLLQFGLYATPIAYPSIFVPEKYKWLYFMNPMTGIIEGFRWSIFGLNTFDNKCYISFLVSFVMFFAGIAFFLKVESKMADIV